MINIDIESTFDSIEPQEGRESMISLGKNLQISIMNNGPNNRDSSLFVCLAIDLVWQVSNISIINCLFFNLIPIIDCFLLLPGIYLTSKIIQIIFY